MDKLVLIKEIKQASKGENHWIVAVDQDLQYWNLFGAFGNQPPVVGKAYLFTFEANDRGFNDIKKITPVVNILKQKALKEVANRNDFIRTYSMAFSYSKDLVAAGKVELAEMFDWSDKIYGYLMDRADKEVAKLEKPDA